jgi:type IV pilus assembly protein PilO
MDLRDPKKQKLILSLIAAAGIVYLYLVYDYVPKAKEISAGEVHLTGLLQHIEGARARVEKSDEEKLRSELRALEEELRMAEAMLPLEEEVPHLLKEVERRGMQAGVSSVLFEPRGGTPAELYTEHNYRVSVRGGYHNVGLFLSRVAGLERIICPTELSLITGKLRGEGELEEAATTVIAEFDMITYTTPVERPAGGDQEAEKTEGEKTAEKPAGETHAGEFE